MSDSTERLHFITFITQQITTWCKKHEYLITFSSDLSLYRDLKYDPWKWTLLVFSLIPFLCVNCPPEWPVSWNWWVHILVSASIISIFIYVSVSSFLKISPKQNTTHMASEICLFATTLLSNLFVKYMQLFQTFTWYTLLCMGKYHFI